MNTNNIKLLGIYYSVQKVLANNLAAPLGNGIKNHLNISKSDSFTIAEKTIPFLRKGISIEKLSVVIDKVFSNIDNGGINPDRYLGQEFTIEQTIAQFEKHDAFIHVYIDFMNSVAEKKKTAQQSIIEQITIDSIKLKLNSTEALQLKTLFNGEVTRAPITLNIEELREIIDSMYEVTCEHLGPMNTDQYLSQAVKNANEIVPNFDSSTFL